MIVRTLEPYIQQTLKEEMVFLSGPRQVGKTTLAMDLAKNTYKDVYEYLNWDFADDRKKIISGIWHADKKLFILDEIHKYKNWKNYLKGAFDKYRDRFSILVTGSAKLDLYCKGGDSLLGRYRPYRLHPLSVAEIEGNIPDPIIPFQELNFGNSKKSAFESLLAFGGFPEVFLKQDQRALRLWHNERVDRLVKEDIRDVELIRNLSSLQILVQLLPEKVGSLFSLNTLREDLSTTHKSVALWVDILEKFYYHFRIYPYQSTLIKSLRKEPKLYLWDWSEIEDEGARFENMIASHLLKFCHFLQDVHGYKAELNYLRDKEQRETDFLVSIKGKPWFCVETKFSRQNVPASLKYFAAKLRIPLSFLITQNSNVDVIKEDVRIISADKFLKGLV